MADNQEHQDVEMTGNGQEASGNGEQSQGNGSNGNAEHSGIRNDDRKLFVGGLGPGTTEKELKEHFEQYGEIENINVKTDPNTGRSRGFAFIVYKSTESIEKVFAAGDHVINDKKVDPKKAKARQGKIFVGGLAPEISDEEIKTFFGQFGSIAEVEMPFDKQRNQRKNFCFITFESEQDANEVLRTPKQTISGKEVDVKKATPKADHMQMGGRGGMRGGPRGGMRGARGGFGGARGYNQGWDGAGYGGPGYGNGYGYSDYSNDWGYGGFGGYDYSNGGGFQTDHIISGTWNSH
ncbi:RNA-binding protein squid-like isoform X2 [Toxorhynchites rutilus septentrionalis]|uniref:RNA-binding protein squid-like isoform X2 n=1 Tax=Toxorhynchites rutilus septentrionalis TaxID=329112 RepID=UPI00247941D4|nr:RNA-binding protein squid-like isoform X2 [Toxorhynchites rutilus septentrionalis]